MTIRDNVVYLNDVRQKRDEFSADMEVLLSRLGSPDPCDTSDDADPDSDDYWAGSYEESDQDREAQEEAEARWLRGHQEWIEPEGPLSLLEWQDDAGALQRVAVQAVTRRERELVFNTALAVLARTGVHGGELELKVRFDGKLTTWTSDPFWYAWEGWFGTATYWIERLGRANVDATELERIRSDILGRSCSLAGWFISPDLDHPWPPSDCGAEDLRVWLYSGLERFLSWLVEDSNYDCWVAARALAHVRLRIAGIDDVLNTDPIW